MISIKFRSENLEGCAYTSTGLSIGAEIAKRCSLFHFRLSCPLWRIAEVL